MELHEALLQYFFSGVANGSVYILIALGFNIIYNATGIINFAQGEFVVLGGFTMVTFSVTWNIPVPVAFFMTVIAVAFIGGVFERTMINPLKKPSVITLIIITIGGGILLRGIAMFVWGKYPVYMKPFTTSTPLKISGAIVQVHTLWILGICAVVVLLLFLFFERTMIGKAMRACSEDRETAQLMGINVNGTVLLSFVLSAALGAIAGIVYTPIASMEYGRGAILGLKGFIVAIIGGLGNGMGSVVAGLLLGLFETFSAAYISSTYKEAITLALLLLVLFVRPSGILGKSEVSKLKEF